MIRTQNPYLSIFYSVYSNIVKLLIKHCDVSQTHYNADKESSDWLLQIPIIPRVELYCKSVLLCPSYLHYKALC